MSNTNHETTVALEGLLDALGWIARELDGTVTIHQLQIWLATVTKKRRAQTAVQYRVAEEIGILQPTMSRNLAVLSNIKGRNVRKTYALLRQEIDPDDRRLRLITPTPRGEILAERLADKLIENCERVKQ